MHVEGTFQCHGAMATDDDYVLSEDKFLDDLESILVRPLEEGSNTINIALVISKVTLPSSQSHGKFETNV